MANNDDGWWIGPVLMLLALGISFGSIVADIAYEKGIRDHWEKTAIEDCAPRRVILDASQWLYACVEERNGK